VLKEHSRGARLAKQRKGSKRIDAAVAAAMAPRPGRHLAGDRGPSTYP
jgi:phage terminase large subunit-like protein